MVGCLEDEFKPNDSNEKFRQLSKSLGEKYSFFPNASFIKLLKYLQVAKWEIS